MSCPFCKYPINTIEQQIEHTLDFCINQLKLSLKDDELSQGEIEYETVVYENSDDINHQNIQNNRKRKRSIEEKKRKRRKCGKRSFFIKKCLTCKNKPSECLCEIEGLIPNHKLLYIGC